jgi:hypothetical protein
MDNETKIALRIRTQLKFAYDSLAQAIAYETDVKDREVSCILFDCGVSAMIDKLKSAITEIGTTYNFKSPW